MPKQVDHQHRRERIADAVCRLAGQQGLDGVTLRHVAAEAGISMGQVQHYFTTKDQMLLFAFDTLSTRFKQRLADTARSLDQPTSVRARLRAILLALVCADEVGRAEAPVWVAFLARAVVNPDLAVPLRHGDLVTFGAEELRAARRDGEISGPIDPDLEAGSLFALADGLMVRTLLDPDQVRTATATIDYQLDRLFGPAYNPAHNNGT